MIVIPDIHGRTFWKEAVIDNENEKIIFLGDYLDPYMAEFSEYYITDDNNSNFDAIVKIRENTIENFKEILEFKRTYKDNVILLLGNHDLEYMISTSICDCRRDILHYEEIRSLFLENKDLFQLCYKEGNVVYSHGGIRKEWIDYNFNDINLSEDTIIDYINNEFESILNKEDPFDSFFAETLGECSFYRGGYGRVSSLVWGDVREWIYREPRPYTFYQVFGHTRLNGKPLVTKDWACLDCSTAFQVNDEGVVSRLDGTSVEII